MNARKFPWLIFLLLIGCTQFTPTVTSVPAPTMTVAPTPAPTKTPEPIKNICGETNATAVTRVTGPFTPENSAIKSVSIRTLEMGKNGLWLGYAGGEGIGFYDGSYWYFCRAAPHVNAIALDDQGHPWVGTDAPPMGESLLFFDGKEWVDRSIKLQDYRVYDLTFHNGNLYVGTWEGVAQFDGKDWTVPYSAIKNLFNNHTHAIAFARNGDKWFGSIDKGVSWFQKTSDQWIHVDSSTSNQGGAIHELGGDNIREIVEHPSKPEVWIGSDPGQLTIFNYETNTWTRLDVPDQRVNDIDFDQYGRPWITTKGGTFYLEQGQWNLFDVNPAYHLVFGCQNCTFNPSTVFIGTEGFGLVQKEVTTPK